MPPLVKCRSHGLPNRSVTLSSMQVSSVDQNPMSSPLSVSMTTESSEASAFSCGGLVPRLVGCAPVMYCTPAPPHAASTRGAFSALATSTGYALVERVQPSGLAVRSSGSRSPAV